ncbi:MAG: imidazoleglycerol-phosphate dehydratase HisB [Clostridiales bacterium]|jgi:imidazoleglycerol-phosphate dehydratase|nr:imidazoleglycerol-phosphate dehydratase HisB [Eubacteriales bacterium]MDH7566343.1 imidazoleglycerol-phosphate dehydratase HisB [Clostridiales bacterium]
MDRKGEITRKTEETDIYFCINLDGGGKSRIDTGIGFFDHMLTLFAKHGLFEVNIKAVGDLAVDAHHTVEDVGIAAGLAVKQALGDKRSIRRYGTCFVPMDESLAMVSVDIGGRPYLVFDAPPAVGKVGEMDMELVEEFFKAFAFNAGINLHIKVLYGKNHHHMVEAVFKAFARALGEASRIDPRIEGVMSTKGML